MKDKTKEIIIKTVIVIGFISLLIVVPGSFVYAWVLPTNIFNIVFYSSISLFAISGVSLIILLPLLGLKQKPVKADKIVMNYQDYDDFKASFEKTIFKMDYLKQNVKPMDEANEMIVYIRSKRIWELDSIVLLRVSECSDEVLEKANNSITETLAEYSNGRITDTVNLIFIVCVDRITSSFKRLVNSNIRQGFKNHRLPVGISFGGKMIYIAKQVDGFAIFEYKKLKKIFLKIMGIEY